MEVKDISWDENISNRQNHFLLPKSIRGLIVGKSGCGKTTLLLNFLLNPGWLDFNKLLVFGKSLYQPEYRILKRGLELGVPKAAILKIFENQEEIQKKNLSPELLLEKLDVSERSEKIDTHFFESAADVPDPRDMKPADKNLMIFDDVLLQKQNTCEMYYTRGRHSNVDCFYLAQNYFKLPRQTIRENANFICLFKQDLKNINHVYQDHASDDMTPKEFRDLCKNAWEKKFGFVVIDLSSNKFNGRYRCGFDQFFIPQYK